MNKILGIDLGTKRIGLAASNIERTFAFPLKVIEVENLTKNLEEITQQISKLAKEQGIGEIIIGESKDFSGQENPIMTHVHKAKKLLEDEGFAVILEPEFMTSTEASRHQGKNDMHDASAAAIILQSYLDRLKKTDQSYYEPYLQ